MNFDSFLLKSDDYLKNFVNDKVLLACFSNRKIQKAHHRNYTWRPIWLATEINLSNNRATASELFIERANFLNNQHPVGKVSGNMRRLCLS